VIGWQSLTTTCRFSFKDFSIFICEETYVSFQAVRIKGTTRKQVLKRLVYLGEGRQECVGSGSIVAYQGLGDLGPLVSLPNLIKNLSLSRPCPPALYKTDEYVEVISQLSAEMNRCACINIQYLYICTVYVQCLDLDLYIYGIQYKTSYLSAKPCCCFSLLWS
jgi:hypothetical protein